MELEEAMQLEVEKEIMETVFMEWEVCPSVTSISRQAVYNEFLVS